MTCVDLHLFYDKVLIWSLTMLLYGENVFLSYFKEIVSQLEQIRLSDKGFLLTKIMFPRVVLPLYWYYII